MSLTVGEIIQFERSFTVEDVETFTKISGDEGIHHMQPDERGRFIIQGLLTATLPTKIGGDHSVLARKMNFEFMRPVFTGDTILCKVTVEELNWEQHKQRTAIVTSFSCENQHGKEVLKGDFTGIINNG